MDRSVTPACARVRIGSAYNGCWNERSLLSLSSCSCCSRFLDWVHRHQHLDVIAYLVEENRVLKEQRLVMRGSSG